MKKFLVCGVALVTIVLVNAQRQKETLIELNRTYIPTNTNKSENKSVSRHVCYAYINQISPGRLNPDLENYHVEPIFKREEESPRFTAFAEESHDKVTVTKCRKDATIFIDGIKSHPNYQKADSIEIITGEITDAIHYPENEISSKTTPGPVTGFEGHNFTEHPAIIYPNPVHDIMQVRSTDPITVIEILNLHGQVIKTFIADEVLSVQDLAAGNYYVRIHFENMPDVQIEKIIITN